MTKKDYDLIAKAISRCVWFYHVGRDGRMPANRRTAEVVLESVAMELAHELADANPRFDQERFMTACEVAA